MSVIDLVPPPPDRSSAASTRARLSSLDFIAAIAAGAPGAVLCSVSSGSLSHSNENWGMPFFQRTSVNAFVVHASRSAGCAAGGNAPSIFTISVMDSGGTDSPRSEEHTSELQSHLNLVCRLLLEKKKNKNRKGRGRRQSPLSCRPGNGGRRSALLHHRGTDRSLVCDERWQARGLEQERAYQATR